MGKILLTKTVVNAQRMLIGFVVEGREKDLGGFAESLVQRPMPLSEMIKSNFANSQISIVDNKVVEKGKFRLNTLQMCVYTGDEVNPFVDIDNTINVTCRYVKDNENIGFKVAFSDGSALDLMYVNLLTISKWFKPGNFCIRTSAQGKSYISGKVGGSLESIPEVIIGEKPEVKPKRLKSSAKEKKAGITGGFEHGLDILDIYKYIKDCGGSIIKLPTEDYVAASEDGETVVDGFTSLGIGEVASPNPAFNAVKLNVNADFKKVGVVPVNINGMQTNLTSFVYRKKSIFLGGENYIKTFGIAVTKEKEAELINVLGKSLALEKISDKSITQPLSQVIDAESLVFYKVDTSKIDLISEKKRADSILSTTELVETCKRMYELKLLSKALGLKGGMMKDIKDVIGDAGIAKAKSKKLFGVYNMMNEEALKIVTEAGIDIYSGAYTKEGTPVKKASTSSGSDTSTEAVEIEYSVKGYDAGKITGKQVLAWAQDKDNTKLPETVIGRLTELFKIVDLYKRYQLASQLNIKVDEAIANLNKKLWMHNASMFLAGNKLNIHTHDKDRWVVDSSTRVKTAQVYECIDRDAEGLTVKFKGVNI